MARYFGVALRNGLSIGLGSVIALFVPPNADLLVGNLELEDGANMLLEDGGFIVLE